MGRIGTERPQAVIFDWGGTLTVGGWQSDGWSAAARALGAGDDAERAFVAAEAQFWARVRTSQESGTLAALVEETCVGLGLVVDEDMVGAAARAYLEAWSAAVRHDPEAGSVLRALRRRGLRIGLLSNTHWPMAFHEELLVRDGLAGLFDARLYTCELTHLKPHPVAFEAALAALGVDNPAVAVFVGDRPHDDIAGAQRVGMRAVLRPNPAIPAEDGVVPDAEINSLPELLVLLDGWNPNSRQ